MSARTLARGFTARPIRPDEREQLFAQAKTLDTEMAANGRAIRIGGYVVGAVGLAIGLAGVLSAAAMLPLKTTETRYLPWNTDLGIVGDTVLAADAPKTLFSDQQARFDLRRYVMAVETWIFEARDENFRIATLMSSPTQTAALTANASPKNPTSPQMKYGNKAAVLVDNFQFSLLAGSSTTSQIWQVRYMRTEIVPGSQPVSRPWVSTVTFSWVPDLIMAKGVDRSLNLTGFQCTSYSSGPI